jgi:hypothetical protein
LGLRKDQWSEGAARVATRLGLQAASFDLAAAAYSEAVGSPISGDSVRRVCEKWGEQVEVARVNQTEAVHAPISPKEKDKDKEEAAVKVSKPLTEQANISSDGVMMLVRKEGWKEVKLTVISRVEVLVAQSKIDGEVDSLKEPGSQRPHVHLSEHSYQAGLWDADTLGQHQYREALKRGVLECPKLSSVNDAARWIGRITETNFPQAVQVVDWGHATGHLWLVGKALWGEQSKQAKEWVAQQETYLWSDQVDKVIAELESLGLADEKWPEAVQQAPGYFKTNRQRMRYATFRAEGYPIGSGSAESAANNLVQHRMKRGGRGWNRESGQAMLAGLSELHSGRFELAWQAVRQKAA